MSSFRLTGFTKPCLWVESDLLVIIGTWSFVLLSTRKELDSHIWFILYSHKLLFTETHKLAPSSTCLTGFYSGSGSHLCGLAQTPTLLNSLWLLPASSPSIAGTWKYTNVQEWPIGALACLRCSGCHKTFVLSVFAFFLPATPKKESMKWVLHRWDILWRACTIISRQKSAWELQTPP